MNNIGTSNGKKLRTNNQRQHSKKATKRPIHCQTILPIAAAKAGTPVEPEVRLPSGQRPLSTQNGH